MTRDFEMCRMDTAEYQSGEKAILSHFATFGQVCRKNVGTGNVVTIELFSEMNGDPDAKQALFEETYKNLKKLLKENGYRDGNSILLIGLGNEGMTADSLGAKTVDRIRVSVGKRPLAAFKTSVGGITGLDTFSLVAGVAGKVRPDFIIAVDTLATKRLSRLSCAVQLSDDGITPGSGVDNAAGRLSYETLGTKVVAIGVPLVIYLKHVLAELSEGSAISDARSAKMVITQKEIDAYVEDFADIISAAVNKLIHKVSK